MKIYRVREKRPIVMAYDGDCLMCSSGVRFFAERDRHRRLRFVKLQSPMGRSMERRAGVDGLSTMLVDTGNGILAKSAAALEMLAALGGTWKTLAILGRCVPRPLADVLYDFIATRRHRLSGGRQACGLPADSVRERLLDGEEV